MINMNKWGLVAWSIEWEGSIFLTKNGTKKTKRGFQINARLSVVCKDRILLERFQQLVIYGKILPHWNKKTNRKYWQFRICKLRELTRILPDIIPYLITKRRRAEIVLKWCKSRLKNWHKRYTDEELQIYKEFTECE